MNRSGAAKPHQKKDEELYEMAIQYKKDEDFPGWYTDVSVAPIHALALDPDLGANIARSC